MAPVLTPNCLLVDPTVAEKIALAKEAVNVAKLIIIAITTLLHQVVSHLLPISFSHIALAFSMLASYVGASDRPRLQIPQYTSPGLVDLAGTLSLAPLKAIPPLAHDIS